MSRNHAPPPRRRGFSSLALLSAGALLFTSTYGGLAVLASSAKAGFAQAGRRPAGPFTQAPTRAFRGQHPGRDPKGRGGMWTAARRGALADGLDDRRLFASLGGVQGTPLHTLAVSPDPGGSYPWEGSAPAGDGSVNTGNGNKLTTLHLLDWKVRGGATLDFTLYHNSQTNYDDELGHGWTWTYDVYVNTSSGSPILHWGDGTCVPYSASGGGGVITFPGGGGGSTGPTTYVPPAGIHDALVNEADGTWTATKKDGTRYLLNADGFLTSVVDRNGNAVTVQQNGDDYATKVTDPTGRWVALNYGFSAGRFGVWRQISDSTGRSWGFHLDSSGELTYVDWPDCGDGSAYLHSDVFAYDSDHRITTHTDRRGKDWTSTYNADGSLASETDPLGHATTYAYGATATTVTDPLGHTATDNYGSGTLASHVDESGYSVSITARNADLQPTSTTDARGKVWVATYDAKGNVLTSTDPLSHTKTFTYNGFSEPLTVTDALGHTTTTAYDSNGNLLTVVNALSKTVVSNTVGSYGLVSSSVNALGKSTSFTYSTDGDVATVNDATGVTTTFGYDALGRVTTVSDGLSYATTTSYDGWERPILTTYPVTSGTTGATKTVAYLATDEVASVTDELGHTTTNGYDDAGRLTSVTNPRGDVETYGYDNADRRTTVTNGRGKVRTYAFTNRGDVSSLTMPDGAVESWSYDGAGNATAYVNPLSQTILYSFDDAGRQTLVDYPTGTDTSFGYDNADRRTSMADATGTTTWAYDAADRETVFSAPQGAQTSGYDDAGQRTSLTGTGISRAWTYDDAGRPLTLSNESSETTSYAYDAAGRLSTTTLANGQVSVAGYDARSRQTSVTHKASASGSTISSESYVYDDAGNLSYKTVDGTTTSYGYDSADQLTSESRTGYSAAYSYDANGNRTSKTLNGVTDNYSVDDGDKLTSITQGATTVKSYAYDAAGRTTGVTSSAGATTLGYDYEGRVTTISGPGVSNSFTYNGLDTRVGKAESSGTKTFRRDGAGVTASVLSDGSAVYTPGVSQRRSGATTFDLSDRLGTAAKQTNSSASTTATRTYDAFGLLVASTGMPLGPFGFAGTSSYQEDCDSGLKLLGHRYYDPSTARFLTRDPAQDGSNWYTYGDNNPTSNLDPSGYGPGPNGGPPPVPIPGMPGWPWQWFPDTRNGRGGTWGPARGPGRPAVPPGQSPPKGSWDPDPGNHHGGPHWDIDDGKGNRGRYGPGGNKLPVVPVPVRPGYNPYPSRPPNWRPIIGTVAGGLAVAGVVIFVALNPEIWPIVIPAGLAAAGAH